MGAWAFKLFTCDYDLNLINELNQEAGLPQLERLQTGKTTTVFSDPASARMLDHRTLDKDKDAQTVITEFPTAAAGAATQGHGAQYSLYARLCSNPVNVRSHLDSGVLAKFSAGLRRQINAAHAWWLKDCYGPGYHLCMLNACAMTLGAHVSEEDRVAMRAVYRDCEFMRDAVLQLEAALDSDTGYVNGTPWDFGPSSIADLEPASPADLAFPAKGVFNTSLINVLGPDHGREEGEMNRWRSMPTIASASAAEKERTIKSLASNPYTDEMLAKRHPDGMWKDYVCGECGSGSSNDHALLNCAKCKKRSYCSKTCQKKHWSQHKHFCKAPGSAR